MADKFDFIEDYFKKSDLLPAIVQERSTGQVLMLAYMNRESMRKTFETGYTWFYSRSRQELCIYYAQNTWSFTRIAKIKGVSKDELKEFLGEGEITVTLSVEK